MKQGQFEQSHRPDWERFAEILETLERKKLRVDPEGSGDFGHLFRRVCHFHAVAKERNYSSFLVDQLGDLVVRGHQQFYRRRTAFAREFLRFFVVEFPRLVRQEQRYFWLATAVFYLPALFLFVGALIMPELIYTIMGPENVSNLEEMYNPKNRTLGSARDAESNWYMFGYYINNNIGVSFRTFASGLAWGIGSGFLLVYNGFIFGGVSAHMLNVGFEQTFFTFVIAHGSFELTAIVISGAAGFKLGFSLLFPGNYSRLEALKRSAKVAIKLVYGVIFMLVIAAFVEAFWSSNNYFEFWQKYLVGAFLWVVVAAYLIWGGRRFGS